MRWEIMTTNYVCKCNKNFFKFFHKFYIFLFSHLLTLNNAFDFGVELNFFLYVCFDVYIAGRANQIKKKTFTELDGLEKCEWEREEGRAHTAMTVFSPSLSLCLAVEHIELSAEWQFDVWVCTYAGAAVSSTRMARK